MGLTSVCQIWINGVLVSFEILMKPFSLTTLCLAAIAFSTQSQAATIDLGWTAAGIADGALGTWNPATNNTGNAGITFTAGVGGTKQSGSSNFAAVNDWVNSPGYNLFSNPNDSWQDGLGNAATQENVSWELVFRPGDFTGKHTLFNTGGNGDGTAITIDGSVVDFRFQDANSNTQRIIVSSDLATIGGATDFYHLVGLADVDAAASGTGSLYINGVLVDGPTTSTGTINDWDGGDLAELGKGNNIPGGNPFNPDAFTGDIAAFNYYGGELLTQAEITAAFRSFAVPEPSGTLLLGLAMAVVGFRRRR